MDVRDGPTGGHDELLASAKSAASSSASNKHKKANGRLVAHVSNPKINLVNVASKALMMTPPMSRESSTSTLGRPPYQWKIGSSAHMAALRSAVALADTDTDDDDGEEAGAGRGDTEDDYAMLLFAAPPSESLRCALHDGLLFDPVIASCGHSFCRACVVRSCSSSSKMEATLSAAAATCPLDGAVLDAERVFPNLAVAGQLRELPVRCKYGVKRLEAEDGGQEGEGELVPDPDGCPEVVALGARRLHETACHYAPAQCPYCDVASLRRMTVAQHTRTCSHIPCPHRGMGCGFQGAEGELEVHLRACVYEGLKGFMTKYEEDKANLVRRLREQRLENMALCDTVAQLTTRVQELVATLDAKTAHYDSVIQHLTNIRPTGPSMLRPSSSAAIMPPAAALGQPAPSPDETDVDSHSYKLKGEFTGHVGPVWALAVNKKQQMLISGSSDESIRIWDLTTFKIRNTLVGHDGIVHAVVVVGRKLISGSSDKTIRVWNLKTMKLERTITGHGNTICKLVVEGNLLFSGSYTEIKAPHASPPLVWNVKTFACIATLKGHIHWVRALCVSGGVLYSGCHNLIKVWDVSTFRCIKNLTGRYGSIYSIAVADRCILAGIYENAIMVFDLDTFECVRALAGHMGAVYAVCVHQRRLFTGSYDNHIKVWNLDNFRCVQTLKRHTSSVEALVVDDEGLYSASSDNSIKMFS